MESTKEFRSLNELSYKDIHALLKTSINYQFAVSNHLIPELEEYKLIYWTAAHLYKMIRICQESKKYYIDRSDTLYSVTMQNCSIESLYGIARDEPDRQIRISFRRARKHWNLDPVAIIKLPASRAKIIDLRDSKGNYNHD
jgi:hypothetical protein